MSRSRKQFLLVSLFAVFFLLIHGSGVLAEERPEPTSIHFGYYDTANKVGTTVKIPTYVIPNYGDVIADQTCTWTSSDESIATVNHYGYVTGHAAGTVTITATAVNGITNETEISFYQEETLHPIYRLYLPSTGEHLYTSDKNEYDTLYRKYNWGQEGIAWYAPDSGTAVYRLYNPSLQNHLYTTDTNEVKVLTTKYGWKVDYDGAALYYSGGDVPIYRVYNEGLKGLHHLTTDAFEYSELGKLGWDMEGQKLSAVKYGEPSSKSVFYNKK